MLAAASSTGIGTGVLGAPRHCVHDGFWHGERCGGDLPGGDLWNRAGRSNHRYHASSDAVFHRRGFALSVWSDAILSGGDGFSGSGRPGGGNFAESNRREIEEGTVFYSSGQWSDNGGGGTRRGSVPPAKHPLTMWFFWAAGIGVFSAGEFF